MLQSSKKGRLLELFIFLINLKEWFGMIFTQENHIKKELTSLKMYRLLTECLYSFKVKILYSHKILKMFYKLRILTIILLLMLDFVVRSYN